MKTTEEKSHSEEQAVAQLEHIRELMGAVAACGDGADRAMQEACERIQEKPLSVEVRSCWYSPHGAMEDSLRPAEFCILLCTGGPAVRIIGELNQHCEPETAVIQHQDWGTPWTEQRVSRDDEETLLAFALEFYFGS